MKERGGLRRMHPPLCEQAAGEEARSKTGSGSGCGIGTAPHWDGREAIEEHQEFAGDPVVRLKCRSERTGDGVPAWRNAPAWLFYVHSSPCFGSAGRGCMAPSRPAEWPACLRSRVLCPCLVCAEKRRPETEVSTINQGCSDSSTSCAASGLALGWHFGDDRNRFAEP